MASLIVHVNAPRYRNHFMTAAFSSERSSGIGEPTCRRRVSDASLSIVNTGTGIRGSRFTSVSVCRSGGCRLLRPGKVPHVLERLALPRATQCNATLPERADSVSRKRGIASNDRRIFVVCLCDKKSVKRIAVMRRQRDDSQRVREFHIRNSDRLTG
jgi:hypothetical protein